ncbi:MAG: TrkA family potassium uptake protein [Roseiflexaceae bacterium]
MLGFHPPKTEYAVIGLGRFGSSLALTLRERGHSVLGIDGSQAVAQGLADRLTRVAVLDSTNEQALRDIDIMNFDTVVVAIGTNFEANLMTTAILKDFGVKHVICKALSERQRDILIRVGASRVVLPEHDGGSRLARELCTPWLTDQISLGDGHSIVKVKVPHGLINRTLQEVDLRRRYGVIVLTVTHQGHLTVIPPVDYTFHEGDAITVVGSNEAITKMTEALANV